MALVARDPGARRCLADRPTPVIGDVHDHRVCFGLRRGAVVVAQEVAEARATRDRCSGIGVLIGRRGRRHARHLETIIDKREPAIVNRARRTAPITQHDSHFDLFSIASDAIEAPRSGRIVSSLTCSRWSAPAWAAPGSTSGEWCHQPDRPREPE